jgi:hypothetical protein
MKNLNAAKKALKLNKETISKLSTNPDKTNFSTTTFPTTSQLCFDLAALAQRV